MKVTAGLSVLSVLAGAEAAETVLGAFIFHRHGDRTPKALAPTNLTALGYEQIYSSGQYYRSRYLSGDSKIRGINTDTVKLSQLAVTAPVDNVLQNSAMGFLQALYPPVQTVQTLANGQNVQAPMDGYQLIPVNTIETGAGSEDAGWLQDASSCANAKSSSNSFFESQEYKDISSSTKDLYSSIVPAINNVIGADQVNFKNGYIVYDILNVASIHNATTSNTPSNATFSRLRTLADAHEWGLAFNATDKTRAVSGMQLAGEVLSSLNHMISSPSKSPKLAIQFGAYATFMSFFGLADLPAASGNFKGVVDYASSMVFELFTNAEVPASGIPATENLNVRFLFHNGTASNSSEPTTYPLFGGKSNELSWTEFQDKLKAFAITSTEQWCNVCGNSTGACSAYAEKKTTAQSGGAKQGMSPAVGGVIGAFVTLAVVLGTLAAVMLIGGFTLVSKKRVGKNVQGANVETKA
ncbi:histidine phosphatase superfamily [Phaeosphaeria sp. MPI-PUGE-AT-0046c]|nr:histidine phosphatase superfamily [Phaeosphaeria sp. MPI-PUGE-AT-0046c]